MMILFGDDSAIWIDANPLFNGFIHGSLQHLSFNIIFLFILIIPAINNRYGFKQIYIITTFISILHWPFVWLNIATPAIGISGTCCYLSSRFFLTRNDAKFFWRGLLLLAIMTELSYLGCNDRFAHSVHLIGFLLGGFVLIKPNAITPL